MATEFTEESVKEFLLRKGGKVKNHELVTHFKNFLNDSARKDEVRERFKNYVNTLATIKLDENKEKILVLKKKYMPDSGGRESDEVFPPDPFLRAKSEPPTPSSADRSDGAMQSRVRSDNAMSASDICMSASNLSFAADTQSLTSTMSSSSLSSGGQELEEDTNASIMSVKERAKHLNRIESETELRKQSTTNLAATRKKDYKKGRDMDGDDSSTSSMGSAGYMPLSPIEREWLVKSSKSDYHLMHELLSKNPELAKVRNFTSGYTALHWACLHGKADVIKLLMGKHGVNVNQRSNGGYTPLHIAAQQGHENVVELLITFKANPNIRDYSGKKPKQYLQNSASSRTQQLLVSSRLGSKTNAEKEDGGFTRNSSNRRSNRDNAIRSLIRASTGAVQRTVGTFNEKALRNSTEDVNSDGYTPKSSPRNSAEPSPSTHRKHAIGNADSDLMPPPSAPARNNGRKPVHSISKESLVSEDKRISVARQVSRSESEPNLGGMVQPSKTTFI